MSDARMSSLFGAIRMLDYRGDCEPIASLARFVDKVRFGMRLEGAPPGAWAAGIVRDPHLSDAEILRALRRELYKPCEPPAPRSSRARTSGGRSGREASRLADVAAELADCVVPCELGDGFAYLDVGCAEGHITTEVAAFFGLPPDRAHACDVLPQPPNPAFTFQLVGQDGLPYQDGQFDLVTAFMSAHHFTDAPQMFSEVRRVLKASGRLLIREHDCTSEGRRLFYDAVHALYACVLGDETTPEEFAAGYAASSGKYASYRSITEWIALAAAQGLELCPGSKPHWPLVAGQPRRDRFDTFYAFFRPMARSA